MQFDKELLYLGNRDVPLRDGTHLTAVNFFDPDEQNTVDVNVVSSNTPVLDVLPFISFGSSCIATFALRPGDKRLFRLALVGLSPVKT